MDDIAFFESSKFNHRGGIWADASRHERSADLFPTTEEEIDDTQSTASAPVLERTSSLLSQTEPVIMERSHSAPVEPQSEEEGAKDVQNGTHMPRAQTVSGSSASSSSSSTKRRTWFGGAREDDDPTSSRQESEDTVENAQRGRTGNPFETLSRRPSSRASLGADEPNTDIPRTSTSQDASERISSTRSTSQHSRSSSSPSQDEGVNSGSEQASISAPSESLFAGFRSKSPGNSAAKGLQPSPTTNFFQTLKSRDKQAISNTAKEAMRKWGVNWGSLKKDTTSSNEDTPDSDSQKQPESQSQKPRPSYAEVRAAVAQRRGGNVDGMLSPGFVPSDPVVIPRSPKNERKSSISSNNQSGYAAASTGSSPSPSSSPQSDKPAVDSASQPISTSPVLAVQSPPTRPRTSSHQSHPGTEAVLGPSAVVDEDEPPVQPIRTQPPAPRAMVIPGIHASHRGEVMSMGYAPPTPLPTEQKKPPAAIQSVYRLWKNPSNQQSDPAEAQTQSQTGFTGQDQDASMSSAPPAVSTVPSSQTTVARPIPPPLPPRSVPANAVQVTSESARGSSELARTSSPASAALQSIVSRDKSKRSSLEPLPSPSGSPRAVKAEMDAPVIKDDQQTNAKSTDADLPTADVTVNQDAPVKPKPPALPPRRSQATIT